MLAASLAIGLLAPLATGALASPQPRTQAQKQTLLDLAFVLGEAHALHRVCAGKDDDTWRARMQQVLDADGTDPAFKARLSASFNSGFASPEAQAKDCSAATAQERKIAARGAALARRMAAAPT